MCFNDTLAIKNILLKFNTIERGTNVPNYRYLTYNIIPKIGEKIKSLNPQILIRLFGNIAQKSALFEKYKTLKY